MGTSRSRRDLFTREGFSNHQAKSAHSKTGHDSGWRHSVAIAARHLVAPTRLPQQRHLADQGRTPDRDMIEIDTGSQAVSHLVVAVPGHAMVAGRIVGVADAAATDPIA